MTVELLSPEGLLKPTPYAHVAVARGGTQVHVAGQTGQDADGALVAGGLSGQVAQAMRNTARGLAGAGATFRDVVRLTIYVTDWTPDKMGDFMGGIESVAAELDLPMPVPPTSLIGVAVLFAPEVLVEVEATAVLD